MGRIAEITKLRAYALQEVTSNQEAWENYLAFAAKLWKHPFSDCLLIYAQNPNAVQVADMATWNSLGYWIKKGSKSLAVVDINGTLKYLFDVADTWSVKHKHPPAVWSMTEGRYGRLWAAVKTDSNMPTLSASLKAQTQAYLAATMNTVVSDWGVEAWSQDDQEAVHNFCASSINWLVAERINTTHFKR